jgi:branched-chain amino acid transport system ATP-binding protein
MSAAVTPADFGPAMLEISGVVVRFGGVVALNGVAFDVGRRQICGLIGPNGSGKTTLFNCISGIYRYSEGEILFEGRKLAGTPRHQLINLGIGRTFQNLALFRTLSVRDNVLVGGHHLAHSGFIRNALRLPVVRAEERRANEQLHRLLHLLDLEDVAEVTVSALPFGTQKRVELARALISEPKLLLLDEPTSGMAPAETARMIALIAALPRSLAILMIEHDMQVVFSLADRITVLYYGEVLATGEPAAITANARVREVYLGTRH